MKKSKTISWLLVIFFLGGLAGMLGSQLFLPWLAGLAPFNKVGWIARSKDGTTIINKTERIVVEQSAAYQETVNRLANSAVAIRAEKITKAGSKKIILAEGSGFILTSDGLVATANSLAPENSKIMVFWNGKQYEARVVRRDAVNNLILLKIGETNLPVVAMGDTIDLKLGEEVFLLGADLTEEKLSKFINQGFFKTVSPILTINFSETPAATGALLSNVSGEVVGMGLVDKEGVVKIVSAEKIKELITQ